MRNFVNTDRDKAATTGPSLNTRTLSAPWTAPKFPFGLLERFSTRKVKKKKTPTRFYIHIIQNTNIGYFGLKKEPILNVDLHGDPKYAAALRCVASSVSILCANFISSDFLTCKVTSARF